MAPYLTDADLRMLATTFRHANAQGRLKDTDHDRTVVVLAAARQRQREAIVR